MKKLTIGSNIKIKVDGVYSQVWTKIHDMAHDQVDSLKHTEVWIEFNKSTNEQIKWQIDNRIETQSLKQ